MDEEAERRTTDGEREEEITPKTFVRTDLDKLAATAAPIGRFTAEVPSAGKQTVRQRERMTADYSLRASRHRFKYSILLTLRRQCKYC